MKLDLTEEQQLVQSAAHGFAQQHIAPRAADIDRDGLTDIITNEMLGNGVAPGAIDVGNMLVLSGELTVLFADGFESGDFSGWDDILPRLPKPELTYHQP